MGRRILFVLVYIFWIPFFFVCCFITAIPMNLAGLIIYIIRGNEDDDIEDIILAPISWVIDLPFKIMGED